jgi:predicted DCC family thiol-disulfide oxidoreductase YuxK
LYQTLPQPYIIIYDGNCNLCVSLVRALEELDKGSLFSYAPMQDRETLQSLSITAQDCEMGMILIETQNPGNRWQGSDAVEEIGRLLPLGSAFISVYRALPGVKWIGDRIYAQIRDNRYTLFGKRSRTYYSAHPIGCMSIESCD